MSILARVLAVLLIAAGTVLMLPLRPAHAATVDIPVDAFFFCSASFSNGVCPTTVNQGDTVEWDFSGGFPHTMTECGGDNNCDNANPTPLWDSGTKTSGQSFSRIFNTPGTFLYQCTIHPLQMRGQIIVVAVGVGGETELANMSASTLRQTRVSDGHLGVWLSLAAISGGVITLTGAAWFARRRLAA